MRYPPPVTRSGLRAALAAALCLGAVPALATPALAQTQRRAVVLRFEGHRAERARRAVIEALASRVELVEESVAVSTGSEIGVDVSTGEGMARVVEHLRITIVVAGSVEGRGRRATTTIVMLDANGEQLASRTAGPPTRRELETIGNAAVEAFVEADALLSEREHPSPAAAPADTGDEGEEEEAPPDTGAPSGDASPWPPRQVVFLGGIRVRTVGSYVRDAAGPTHFFGSDAFPEIYLGGDYHPLFDASDLSRGLLFGVQGGFSLGISYLNFMGQVRQMTAFHFRFDVGYGIAPTDFFELVARVGFGLEGVALESPLGFPSTLYTFVRPAATLRFRLVPELLVLEATLGGRLGIDPGELGAAYGASGGFGGVDLSLGITGSYESFTWAARLGYVYMGLAFNGLGGTMGNGVGGLDETIEGLFLVGYTM